MTTMNISSFVETQRFTSVDWPAFVHSRMLYNKHGLRESFDYFGDIRLDQDVAAIEVLRDDGPSWGDYKGEILMMERDENSRNWVAHSVIENPGFFSAFFSAFDLRGDMLVVGSNGARGYYQVHAGKACIYSKNEHEKWDLFQCIEAKDVLPVDGKWGRWFGDAVAIHPTEDRIFVADRPSPFTEDKFIPATIYVIDKQNADSNWTLSSTLRSSLHSPGDSRNSFGQVLVPTEHFLALTSYPLYERGQGLIYLFYENEAGEWEEIILELPCHHNPSNRYSHGYPVAATSNTVVVGAPMADENKGAVLVYENMGETNEKDWHLTATLRREDSMPNDAFGSSVAINVSANGTSTIMVYQRFNGYDPYSFTRFGRVGLFQYERKEPNEEWNFVGQLMTAGSWAYYNDSLLIGNGHAIKHDGAVFAFKRDDEPLN